MHIQVEVAHDGQATLLVVLFFQALCGVEVEEFVTTCGEIVSDAESRPIRAAPLQQVVHARCADEIQLMPCDTWFQLPFYLKCSSVW